MGFFRNFGFSYSYFDRFCNGPGTIANGPRLKVVLAHALEVLIARPVRHRRLEQASAMQAIIVRLARQR
jgi:hypothetical protein